MRKRMKQYLSLFLSLCMLMLATPTISLAENDTVPVGTPESSSTAEPTTEPSATPESTATAEPTAEPSSTEEVTEEPASTDAAPAYIVELTGAPETMEATYGLYEDELDLPEMLTAVYSDGARTEVSVRWVCISDGLGGTAYDGECEDYEQACFTFEARLPEGALCAEGLTLPRVEVRLVLPDFGGMLYTVSDKPTITNTHGVLSYDYTAPEGVTVEGQQWLKNSTEIAGATDASYTLTMDDMKDRDNVLSVQLILSNSTVATSAGYAMSANDEWELGDVDLAFTGSYDQKTTDFPLKLDDIYIENVLVESGASVSGVNLSCNNLTNQGTISNSTLQLKGILNNPGTISGSGLTVDENLNNFGVICKSGIDCENVNNVGNGVIHVPVTINGEDCSSTPDTDYQFLWGDMALDALNAWYANQHPGESTDGLYWGRIQEDGDYGALDEGLTLGLSGEDHRFFGPVRCFIEAPEGLVSGATVYAGVEASKEYIAEYAWYYGGEKYAEGSEAELPQLNPGETAVIELKVYLDSYNGKGCTLQFYETATFSGIAYDVTVDYEADSLIITPRGDVTIDGAVVQVGNSTFAGVPVDGKCTLPLSYFGDGSFDASLYVYNDGGQLAGPTSLHLSRAAESVDPADFSVTVADTANADGTRDVTVHCANPDSYNAIRVGEKIFDAAETIIRKVQPGADVTVYARTPGSDAGKLLPSPWVAVGTIEASKWLHLNVSSQHRFSSGNALFWGEVLKIETNLSAAELKWTVNGAAVDPPALDGGMYTIPANVSSLSITATDSSGSITRELSDIECPVFFGLNYGKEALTFWRKDICPATIQAHIGTKDYTLDDTFGRSYPLSDSGLPKNEAAALDVTLESNGSSVTVSVAIPARFAGQVIEDSVSYYQPLGDFHPGLGTYGLRWIKAQGRDGVAYAAVKLVGPSLDQIFSKDSTDKWVPPAESPFGMIVGSTYSIYAKQYSVDAAGRQNSFASDWFDTGVRIKAGEIKLSTYAPLVGDTITATENFLHADSFVNPPWRWAYCTEGESDVDAGATESNSFTILPGSGYENRRLTVKFVDECDGSSDLLGYAETEVIPEAQIVIRREDGTELKKDASGNYIAYLGDKLKAEVKNVSPTFLKDADEAEWTWESAGPAGSFTTSTSSLELDKDRFGDFTHSDVYVMLRKGTDEINLSCRVKINVAPAPDVQIDYENETLFAVKPDNGVLADYQLYVKSSEGEEAISEGESNICTVPISNLSSDWPDGSAHELVAFWVCTGKTNSEQATLTIPARPVVQKPTTYPAAFAITVEGVSLADYEMKLVAKGGAVTDESVGTAVEDATKGNVRFTGLESLKEYTLWMRKKATDSTFRSEWTSFDVGTRNVTELVPSLTWTASYSPNGFSLSAEDVLDHVSFTNKATGRKVIIPVGYLKLTRADGKPFPITNAGTYSLRLTLLGLLADNYILSPDTITLTVQPYTVSTYTFASRKTYKGAAYDPYDFELRVGGAILGKSDYTITVDDGAVLRDVGEYTAHIVFKGNFTSKLDGVVHPAIDPYTLRATASPKSREYDGTVNVECSASWDNCAPFAGDDVAVKASGTMADASAGIGKAVAITLWLEGAQSGNYRLASSTLTGSVNIAKEKAPDIDWPTAGDISYGQCLADSVLSHTRDANGTFAWEKPEHVPTRAMEWAFTMIYTPDDEVNYVYEESKLRKTITIRVNRAAAPEIQWPTAGNIIYGQRLADSVLTGSDLNGSFAWENGDMLPPAGLNSYNVVFTPDDPDNYAWTPEMLVRRVEVIVDQKPVNLTVGNASKIYGDADPEVEVSVSGVLEGDSLDYTISRRSGEDVGEYAYSVELGSNPNYRPEILLGTLTIQPRDIADSSVSISAVGRQTYTGREIKPAPKLRFGGATLVQGTDYELSYANNVRLGRATITITGMGNFCGSCDLEFRIIEAPEETPATIEPIRDEALQEYLNGMDSLVFDAAYEPVDFAQLPVLVSDGEVEERILLICASQEEDGEAAQRSLILNAAQLVRLQQTLQEYEIGDLIFENGSAAARMNLAELTGGNMAKLMALILSGEEITDEVLQSDWSAMEDAALTEAAYERFNLEVRIAPVTQEDGEQGFEISIWLRCDGLELNVSELMENLRVVLDVRHLVTEENADASEGAYAIARRNVEEIELLDSTLALAPTVSVDGITEATPMIAGHYALTAPYAGDGMYQVAETELK